jgi:hypothetical protein
VHGRSEEGRRTGFSLAPICTTFDPMSSARRWLCIALFASFGGCADDSAGSTDARVEQDASASSGSDASASRDAAAASDANGAGADSGGASADAGGSTADADGASSADGGGSPSSDAGSTRDGGAEEGGFSQDAGGSGDSGAASGKISCDPQKILCRVVEPSCPPNQVPSVQGSCYGPCVAIDQCSCGDAPECPQPDTYTCHRSARHCGPYVN